MSFIHFSMTSNNITELVDNNIQYSFMAHKSFLRKYHVLKDFIELHVTSRKSYDMTLIFQCDIFCGLIMTQKIY